MPTHTQAAVVRKKSAPFRFQEVILDDPQNDEMLVSIVASGICHTDMALREGLFAPHFPCVLGHEGAGIVEAVGKKVTKFLPGDKVLLSFNSCGRCRKCRSGHPAHCRNFYLLNFHWQRPDGTATLWDRRGKPLGGSLMGQSSLAYKSLVNQRSAIEFKGTLEELKLYAPLGCGIQTGAGTVLHELKPTAGEILAIFGAGAVGLAALLAGRLVGARVVCIDVIASRLKIAEKLGAELTLNANHGDIATMVKTHLGLADTIVETSGKSSALAIAQALLAPKGRISLLAINADLPGEEVKLPPFKRAQKVIESIAGDSHPQAFLPYLIECHKQGLFPFEHMLKYYPAKDINKAVKAAASGRAIKPVLLF